MLCRMHQLFESLLDRLGEWIERIATVGNALPARRSLGFVHLSVRAVAALWSFKTVHDELRASVVTG